MQYIVLKIERREYPLPDCNPQTKLGRTQDCLLMKSGDGVQSQRIPVEREKCEFISRQHCMFTRYDLENQDKEHSPNKEEEYDPEKETAEATPPPQILSVTDSGSRNGTYVNGEIISKETFLQDEDRVNLGPTLEIIVRIR